MFVSGARDRDGSILLFGVPAKRGSRLRAGGGCAASADEELCMEISSVMNCYPRGNRVSEVYLDLKLS